MKLSNFIYFSQFLNRYNYVLLNFKFFFAKIECGLYFLNRFDVLISKIIKKKKIIGMYFGTKNYLKSNRYHTVKHTLRLQVFITSFMYFFPFSIQTS